MSRHGARDARKSGRTTVDRMRWQRRRTWPAVMTLEDRRMLSTFAVTCEADSAPAASPAVNTLRWAVEQANEATSASSIEIELGASPATITLAQGPLALSNTMYATTIYDGPGEGSVTISGNNASQVIQVEANVTGSISGVTISDGSTMGGGGGLYNDGGTVMLTDCTVSGNSASVSGGGLYTVGYGTTSLTDCTIGDNFTSGNGGGLASSTGTTTMTGCTISGNSASGNGGGVLNFFSTTALSDCMISGNSAAGNGGGLYDFVGTTILNDGNFLGNDAENGGGLCDFIGTGTLANCSFSGNTARESGAGIYSNGSYLTLSYGSFTDNSAAVNGGGLYDNGGTITLEYGSFSGNIAGDVGGGVDNMNATISLTAVTVSGNVAGNGGGVANLGGTTGLTDCAVNGNTGTFGGGVYNVDGTTALTNVSVSGNIAVTGAGLFEDDGTATLTDSVVSGNSAVNEGGGVFNELGTATLLNCSISDNDAGSGGGVGNDDSGTTTLTNCTVSGNSASENGGGVDGQSSSTTALTNCTVSGNSAGAEGGGIDNESGLVRIGNTIVAANAGVASGPNAVGSFASQGNNLIDEVDGSSGWVDSDLTGTKAQPLNALLAPLGIYGGSTQTMALLPGSPAIDAGNNALIPAGVTTDQRGLSRIVNGVVDIGAFESSGFTIAVTSGSGQSADVLTPFAAPLVATVTANNSAEPVAGGLVTFTPQQGGPTATLGGNPATISATGTVGVAATANAIGGTYTVTATANGISNSASFRLTNKWVPTFSVASQTIMYGTGTTTLSGELGAGMVYPAGSIVQITLDSVTQTTTVDDSGNFTTTFDTATLGVASGPYTVSYAFAGTLLFASAADASTKVTVTPAPLTITASSVTRVYGASDPALGVTYSGFVNGETSSVLGGALSVVDTDAASTTGAGNYAGAITASGLTATNYAVSYNDGNLIVTPAPLTITASSVTRVYGASDPALGVTYSGFVNGETSSVLGGALSVVDSDAAPTTGVENYAGVIVASGLTSTNYTISYSGGNLTVTPAPLTITASGVSRVYGASDPSLGVTYSGFVNGETSSVLGGALSVVDSDAAPTTGVGSFAGVVIASGLTSTNYTISYNGGNLTVTPAPLTITASGISRVYGAADPALGVTYSGFVNGETSSVLGGTLSVADSDAASTTGVGNYAGAISASGLTSTNYTIGYVAGNLTVTPAPLTITTSSVTKTYGQTTTFTNTSFATSGLVNSDTVTNVSLSSTGSGATATVSGSPYAIVASGAVGSGLGNYAISYVNGSLTVNPAPLTITANSATKTYGQTDTFSGTAFSTGGLLNSDSVSTVSLSSTGAGATATVSGSPYAIVASGAVGSGLGNYAISYVNGSLTVNPAPLTILANNLTKTYGQTETFAGTAFSTTGLLNSDSVSSVSLSSTGAAASATVSGSPYAIVASGAVGSGLGNYTIDYANGSLTVNPAVTAVATTPSATAVTLNASSVTLKDTAVLSGGYNETGTITFTLYLGSTLEKTQTVSVSGNGSYTTPTGYTLPTTGTVTGTYQWDSSYSGDSNDLAASETNASNEQVKVSAASPSITTTPNTTTGMCGTSETLKDTATLAGAYNPAGTITFTLYSPNDTVLDTETMTVNGDGTYSTPRGYSLPTNPAPGTYQWDASCSGDKNNNTATDYNDNAEQVMVGLANPSITTRPSTTSATCGTSVTLMDTASLSGGDNPTGSITFTLYSPSDTLLDTEVVSVNRDGTYTTPRGYALPYNAAAGTYQWDASYSGNSNNNPATDDNDPAEQVVVSSGVRSGQTAPLSYWCGSQGQSLIKCLNGGSSCTNLGSWLAATCPNLFGNLSRCSNSQVASYCNSLNNGNSNQQACGQVLATAISCYVTNSNLAGNAGQSCGFSVTSSGTGACTYNVGSNGAGLGVSNNSSCSVFGLLQQINNQSWNGAINSPSVNPASSVCGSINRAGGSQNATLSDSGLAYSPAQIRDAYGINTLGAGLTTPALDGTGQTIAIVEAYDDPDIFQAVDDYDTQFSLTDTGPSLYDQYGPSSSFLTVVNQNGQTASLPETDPSGAGTANWELEESLDVEWAHAIAPGAQIVVVEANSQSLPDLMASVATAASQPGVSVVSMSWGLPEGQAVFASDEATYDSVFNVPGVTFVASTGDYGGADPEYPAFSPNVVAVGGTSLNLNGDGSYNSETGWGYQSDSVGAFIGSGGGISLYEPEPAYQEGVQSTGSRTIPDVSFDADPATGAWVADPYNLGTDNPFEVVGGTSLSAPTWAGLLALVNEGRAVAGESTLDSTSPTETQQALYSLPQSDYNVISSGFNGYTANAGYNLVTGLGTPVANLLVGDLVDYQGPGTVYSGPTVGVLQDATFVSTGSSGGDTSNVFSVFSAFSVSSSGLGSVQGPGAASSTMNATPAQNAVASHAMFTPFTTLGTTGAMTPGSSLQTGAVAVLGGATEFTPVGMPLSAPFALTATPAHAGLGGTQQATPAMGQAAVALADDSVDLTGSEAPHREVVDQFLPLWNRAGRVSDTALEELAADPVIWSAQQVTGTITLPALSTGFGTSGPVICDPLSNENGRSVPAADCAAGLAVLSMAAGLWARCNGFVDARKRRRGQPFGMSNPI
jgi:parallel beta-helix repeat protein